MDGTPSLNGVPFLFYDFRNFYNFQRHDFRDYENFEKCWDFHDFHDFRDFYAPYMFVFRPEIKLDKKAQQNHPKIATKSVFQVFPGKIWKNPGIFDDPGGVNNK